MELMVDDTEIEQLQNTYDEMDANGKKHMLCIAENLLNVQKMATDEETENSKVKG